VANLLIVSMPPPKATACHPVGTAGRAWRGSTQLSAGDSPAALVGSPDNGGSGFGYSTSPNQLTGGACSHHNLAELAAGDSASLEAGDRRMSRSSPFSLEW